MLFLLLCTLILKRLTQKASHSIAYFTTFSLNIVTIYKKYVAICQIICIPIFYNMTVLMFNFENKPLVCIKKKMIATIS